MSAKRVLKKRLKKKKSSKSEMTVSFRCSGVRVEKFEFSTNEDFVNDIQNLAFDLNVSFLFNEKDEVGTMKVCFDLLYLEKAIQTIHVKNYYKIKGFNEFLLADKQNDIRTILDFIADNSIVQTRGIQMYLLGEKKSILKEYSIPITDPSKIPIRLEEANEANS